MVYTAADDFFGPPYLLSTSQALGEKKNLAKGDSGDIYQGGEGENFCIGKVIESIYETIKIPGTKEQELVMDAFIAELIPYSRIFSTDIVDLDNTERILMEPELGMEVTKIGAQTGKTSGTIFSMHGNIFYFHANYGT